MKRKWIISNTVALFSTYLLYTPIAHGFTGGHTRDLNTAQIIAHSIGLAFVATVLIVAQKRILKKYINVTTARMVVSVLLFVSLFWFGYYQTFIPDGPDYDILFAFLVLGSGAWIGRVKWKENRFRIIISILAFPFASLVAEIILILIFAGFDIPVDMQNNMGQEILFWISIGGVTGLLGGWIQSLSLIPILNHGEKE